MGSRGQIFKRTIEGTDGVILEIKGFSLEKDIINILTYEFMALENEKKEQMLYRSEGIKAFKKLIKKDEKQRNFYNLWNFYENDKYKI